MWSTRSRAVGTCRTSVTQTFVSLYGFSVMHPPLCKEGFWTLSFVTVFFLCFYFFNSQFWLYSIWCTLYICEYALCTVHCTIFCVMSGLSSLGQPHYVTNYPPLKTLKNTHNICTQTFKIHITAADGCPRVAIVTCWIWIGYWSINSVRSWCSFNCPSDNFHRMADSNSWAAFFLWQNSNFFQLALFFLVAIFPH